MKKSRYQVGKSGSKQFRAQFRRALQGCERLESRQLMAVDMVALVCRPEPTPVVASQESAPAASLSQAVGAFGKASDLANPEGASPVATHHYFVGGQQLGMHVHPQRIALSMLDGGSNNPAWETSGFSFVRTIDTEFDVYETTGDPKQLADTLQAQGIVAESIPVFVFQGTGSEAVLVDELIVALKPGVKPEEFFANRNEFSAYRRLDGTPDQFVATVATGKGAVALAVLNELQSSKLAGAEWIEPNFYQNWQKYYIPNDPRFSNLWHLHNIGQGGALFDADSDLPEAWDINQGGSPDYVIGIVDDSVAEHPDLTLWTNPGEIPGNGIDDDGNGWVDDIHGWNFVSNNNFSGPTTSTDVHGTPVAGVAAAKGDNGLGVVGASYNSSVSSARMFEGFAVANDANIAAALYYMGGRTADGLGTWKSADIVNNSWGGGAPSSAVTTSVIWGTSAGRMGAGVPIFFAAGNTFGSISYPATLAPTVPGLLAIGATNSAGNRSNYSAFGAGLSFVAPSNDTREGFLAIDTTDRVGNDGYDPSDYTGTGANGFGGTSSATPLAVGIAALVMDQADDLGVIISPAHLERYLQNATDLIGGVEYDMVTGKQIEFGFGRLNAATAVAGIGKAEISVLTSSAELTDGTSVIDLGDIFVGQFTDMTFRVRNQGTSTLDLSGLNISSGVFTIHSGLSDTSLSIGEAAIFTVRFNPTAVGSYSSTVTLLSNDSDEGTFTFDMIAGAQVRSISGFVVEDWDGDSEYDPQDIPLANRLVYIDENNNGLFEGSEIPFIQTIPFQIFDNTTVSSDLVVSGLPSSIVDVNVRLDITHTWNADLDISLVSPVGDRVRLFFNVGGSSDNFTNTVLDDEAALPIESGSAPFTGSFRPIEPLSTFDGTDPNGTWTLEVTDVFGGDQGFVNFWGLNFATGVVGEPSTLTDADGYYFFDGLAPATYNVRTAPVAGWEPSGDNLQQVTLTAPDDFALDANFGSAQNGRMYGLVFDDTNADGVFDSTESPLEGRQIFIDLNENGLRDTESASFLNTTPAAIDDFTVAFSPLTISGLTLPEIIDVNIRVDINHTYTSDLDAYLVHPDGTRILLFSGVGGAGEDFTDTVLDDQAESDIFTGNAPFTGSFRPFSELASFNGKDANGTWFLEIWDFTSKDFGTLNEWELIINTSESTLTTDSLGRVAVDLAPGAYDLYLQPEAGWANTIPTDGRRSIDVADEPVVNQSFGSMMATVPPSILMSMAAGTSWPTEFLQFMDGSATGTGNGLGMPMTANLAPVMFDDLNRLYLQFTEDVSQVSASTIELRNSFGVLPISVSYDSSTWVATISLTSPLQAGKYRLAASDLITNAAGEALDGDNNGTAGGILNFRFDVLPGDANGDQRVNGSDLSLFNQAFNQQVGQAGYNHAVDWNADGRINGGDLSVFSANFNRRIDTLSEPGAPFGGGGQARLSGIGFPSHPHDNFFKDLDEEDEKDGAEYLYL